MKGMTITFQRKVANGVDSLNNPTYTTEDVAVDDVLVAPIAEPSTAREHQAMTQSRIQMRVHMPKSSDADVANSDFEYDGKTFHVDNDSVVFMPENTPTRWNRYFRAEVIDG